MKWRAIVAGDAIYEWKKMPKGQKKPKYQITFTYLASARVF